jgi:hypothetical protein
MTRVPTFGLGAVVGTALLLAPVAILALGHRDELERRDEHRHLPTARQSAAGSQQRLHQWVSHATVPLSLHDGDRLGARALADGM